MAVSILRKSEEVRQITLPTPFLVGPVHTYLVRSDALTLIDTGPKTEEAQGILLNSLEQMNVRPEDIELVVLTHHHPDHTGLTAKFLPNALIAGHPKMKPWLDKDETFFQERKEFFCDFYTRHGMPEKWVEEIEKGNQGYMVYTDKSRLDIPTVEGEEIDGLSGWTVIDTPGHAQTHISLFREKDTSMIAGDHILGHISSNAILEAPYKKGEERPRTLLQYRDALKKCRHINMIYPGHGEDVKNPPQLIEKRLREQETKAQVFKQFLKEEPSTAFEVCKFMYPDMYQKQPSLTFSETLGHLDLLEEYGEVKVEEDKGRISYKSV